MKVAIFLDLYTPSLESKDPGQLTLGFRDLGTEAEILAIAQGPEHHAESAVPIRYVTLEQVQDEAFWAATAYDLLVCYTWLRPKYLPVLSAIRAAGRKVFVKADSDGRYTYPVWPRWGQDIVPTISVATLRIALRMLKRRVFAKSYLSNLIGQLELSDGIFVESPGAFSNLAAILAYAGRTDLAGKIYAIPNPVEKGVVVTDLETKEKVVLAVGDWTRVVGEGYQKNTNCMAKVAASFLAKERDYKFIVIGKIERPTKFFSLLDSSSRERLLVLGEIPHSEVIRQMNRAQILLMPSMVESFGIAASEAICMGCSIVVTPLEPLIYLAGGGIGGTISHDFGADAVLGALLSDVNRWARGEYEPSMSAKYWRQKLAPIAVCKEILDRASISAMC